MIFSLNISFLLFLIAARTTNNLWRTADGIYVTDCGCYSAVELRSFSINFQSSLTWNKPQLCNNEICTKSLIRNVVTSLHHRSKFLYTNWISHLTQICVLLVGCFTKNAVWLTGNSSILFIHSTMTVATRIAAAHWQILALFRYSWWQRCQWHSFCGDSLVPAK